MTDFWTMPEITRLRELYPVMTARQVAEQLGKSVHAVSNMAKRLRLNKRRDWSAIAANHRPVVFAVRVGEN
jgi:hypothetical protein